MQNPRVALATISLFAQLPLDIFFLGRSIYVSSPGSMVFFLL
jgi:hypothetical protein